MILKKLALITLITGIFAHITPINASNHSEIRIQALAALGVILGVGGTYQLIKRSESNTYRLSDILSGALLLAAGAATIFISGQLVHEIDQYFSQKTII